MPLRVRDSTICFHIFLRMNDGGSGFYLQLQVFNKINLHYDRGDDKRILNG